MRRFAGAVPLITGWDVRRDAESARAGLQPVERRADRRDAGERLLAEEKPPPADIGPGSRWLRAALVQPGAFPTPATHATRGRPTLVGDHPAAGHGFEPQISVSLATERTLICVITISYDRHIPGEDERALTCYRRLNERLLSLGYPPYRWSVVSGEQDGASSAFDRMLRVVTAALDPNGILAPGRDQLQTAAGARSPQPRVPENTDREAAPRAVRRM